MFGLARNFLKQESGAILVPMVLLFPILVGFSGLAIDTGVWYKAKQDAQIAADAAALAGALEIALGNKDIASIKNAALTDAAKNGLAASGTGAAMSTTVVVNNPPLSGTNAGNVNAVEVIITTQRQPYFSALYLSENLDIQSRAVAISKVGNGGSACVLALNKTVGGAVTFSGSNTSNFVNCVIASNSISDQSVLVSGSSDLTAASIYAAGGIYINSSNEPTLTTPVTQNSQPIDDPFADTTVPSYGGCTVTGAHYNKKTTITINPGVYCGGIQIDGQQTVKLNPGTYYLTDGDLHINQQSLVSCNCSNATDGVTIVLTGSSPGSVKIDGGSTAILKAPTGSNDPFKGFVLYQDRNALQGNDNFFNGNSDTSLGGTVYFPSGDLIWNGNGTTTAPTCTQLVGDTLTFSGNSTLTDTNCSEDSASAIITPSFAASLVE